VSQTFLFLLATGLTGVFSSRYALSLAKAQSELPLKTVFATVLAIGVSLAGFDVWNPPQALVWFAVVFCSIYIYGLIVITALARGKRFDAATTLTDILYWTSDSRFAVRRLLSQLAIQQGDTEKAVSLLGDKADNGLLAQVYSISGQWEKVLALDVPEDDMGFLVLEARVKAHLEQNNLRQAEAELATLRGRWEQNKSVTGYSNLILSEARIAAEDGRVEVVRDKLKNPPPGVAAYLLYGIVARACEQGGYPDQAKKLYAQAYATAPEGVRDRFADKLGQYEVPLPKVEKVRTPYATYSLLTILAVCFVTQLWVRNRYGNNSDLIVGAFLLGFPEIPEHGAWWRYLSSGFLHANFVHIAANSWTLFQLGAFYEARRHWGSLLACFVVSAIMGCYFVLVAQSGQQLALVGASAGAFGVAAAILTETWRGRSLQDRSVTRSLIFSLVLMTFISLSFPSISFWGHTGGFVGGLLWGFLRQGLPKHRNIDLFAGGVSIAFIVFALLQAGEVFFRFVR
jgi:rhomboid protease GluP